MVSSLKSGLLEIFTTGGNYSRVATLEALNLLKGKNRALLEKRNCILFLLSEEEKEHVKVSFLFFKFFH